MRKIITTTWVTLDGYIAGPNGEMDWIGEIYDDAMGTYENDLVSSADTLLLGRVTYQSFAGSWPHVPDNPNAPEDEKEYARKCRVEQFNTGERGRSRRHRATETRGWTRHGDLRECQSGANAYQPWLDR